MPLIIRSNLSHFRLCVVLFSPLFSIPSYALSFAGEPWRGNKYMVGAAWLRTLRLRKLKSFAWRDRGAKRGSHPRHRWVPAVEILEDRWLPSLSTITNLSDSAFGFSTYGQDVTF